MLAWAETNRNNEVRLDEKHSNWWAPKPLSDWETCNQNVSLFDSWASQTGSFAIFYYLFVCYIFLFAAFVQLIDDNVENYLDNINNTLFLKNLSHSIVAYYKANADRLRNCTKHTTIFLSVLDFVVTFHFCPLRIAYLVSPLETKRT